MAIDPSKQLPKTATTANERLFDAMVRHQVHLLRVSGSIRNRVHELLDATEADIARKIKEGVRPGLSPSNLKRAQLVGRQVRKIREQAWDEVDEVLRDSSLGLAASEAAFAASAVATVSPVVLDLVTPPAAQLRALVSSSPFEGKVLREWSASIRRADLGRIEDQIRIGVVQGETTPQIARRVVGTARLRGVDGTTQITRRQAEGLVRTATIHYSNQARNELFSLNRDIVSVEQYVATLDSRTTPVCKALDGKLFPVGEGRFPPVHFNCRSLRVAVLDGEVLGRRPAKPFTRRQLLREFVETKNLRRVGSRDDLPRGEKGAFDRFERKRIRELVGKVPAKVSYQEWLQTQSRQFQDDTLGSARARLFRDGGLTLDRFVNRAGDELTLSQLAQRDRSAFVAAGLDPDEF